jgi:hypothetical protein
MTLKGKKQLPKAVHRMMARLLQTHFETDPRRIAHRFGVCPEYVRQTWREMPADEMSLISEVTEAPRA